MGGSSWSASAYSTLRSAAATMTKEELFTSKTGMDASMNPNGVTFRESRDSDANPTSLAISVWLDVTGSMHRIPEVMVREKLGPLVETMLAHNVPYPAIMFGAIGDHVTDRAPLQVGQFESGTTELNTWLTTTFLEGGGGGGGTESYLLAWLFCARHTSIDCYEKRGQKGFLFTIGDEMSHSGVEADHLKKIMGYPQADAITDAEVLAEAQRIYNVYHIHVNEGSYRNSPSILGYWKKMLPERLIVLDDYSVIAEVIASTVAMAHGAELATITSSFDSITAGKVSSALATVNAGAISTAADTGVINL